MLYLGLVMSVTIWFLLIKCGAEDDMLVSGKDGKRERERESVILQDAHVVVCTWADLL